MHVSGLLGQAQRHHAQRVQAHLRSQGEEEACARVPFHRALLCKPAGQLMASLRLNFYRALTSKFQNAHRDFFSQKFVVVRLTGHLPAPSDDGEVASRQERGLPIESELQRSWKTQYKFMNSSDGTTPFFNAASRYCEAVDRQ